MSMDDLSSVLWRERELLETLLFKLEVERLVLASSRACWLALAAREIVEVLDAIREVELLRGLRVDAVAGQLGLEPNPSFREIAETCDEPWETIWLEHRDTFATVVSKISSTAVENRKLLTSGYQAAQATLASLSDFSATYSADDSTLSGPGSSVRDRAVHSRMLTALADAGTRCGRVESALSTVDDATLDMQAFPSELRNVDIATAIDLQLQELAYQAALEANARVIQPSLTDFLR